MDYDREAAIQQEVGIFEGGESLKVPRTSPEMESGHFLDRSPRALSRGGARREEAMRRALPRVARPWGRRHAAALHLQASEGGASRRR